MVIVDGIFFIYTVYLHYVTCLINHNAILDMKTKHSNKYS